MKQKFKTQKSSKNGDWSGSGEENEDADRGDFRTMPWALFLRCSVHFVAVTKGDHSSMCGGRPCSSSVYIHGIFSIFTGSSKNPLNLAASSNRKMQKWITGLVQQHLDRMLGEAASGSILIASRGQWRTRHFPSTRRKRSQPSRGPHPASFF